MMKKRILASLILTGALFMGAMTVGAEEAAESAAESAAEAVTEEAAGNAAEAVAEKAAAGSEDGAQAGEGIETYKWSDYVISIDGTLMKFPMTYEAFQAYGYSEDDDMTATLQPMQYGIFYFKDGEKRISARIANFANNTLPATECLVCGIGIDTYYWPADEGEVLLPQGIVRGKSTLEDIKAAYGEPSDVYEGDLYTKLTYETDIYESLEMEIDAESGVLTDINIENLVEPEDFDAGEVSSEVPASVTAYEKPAALSDEVGIYQIRVMDNVYDLPVPVSVLIADGWELNAENSAEFIAAKSSDWVTLLNGGQKIHALAQNFEDNAVLPENSWITSLEVGHQDLDVDGELPGGIKVDMSVADLEKILTDAGIEYELNDESENFHYYTFSKNSWDQYVEVVTYHNGDTYPSDAVLTIMVYNAEIGAKPGDADEAA